MPRDFGGAVEDGDGLATDEAVDPCVREDVWETVRLSWRVMKGCECDVEGPVFVISTLVFGQAWRTMEKTYVQSQTSSSRSDC